MYGDIDAQTRTAPALWCGRAADERFLELLNPGDTWRAHGLGVWMDELPPGPEDTE